MMSFSIAEAHQYEHGTLSATQNNQEKAFEILCNSKITVELNGGFLKFQILSA